LLLFRREIAQKMHLPTNNGGIDADFGFSDRAGQDQRIPVACLFFRRAVKPARKNRFFVQGTGLPRQNDKHRLGDFLGQLGIAHPPQRCRINEAGMAGNQRGKGGLGLLGRVFPHQRHVIGCHSLYSCTPKAKRGQRIFSFWRQTVLAFRAKGHPARRELSDTGH